MRAQFSAQLNNIITIVFVIIAFFVPLIVLPFTTEYYDTPKLILLLIAALILLLLKSLSWVLEGKVLITKTPLDLPLFLFLITTILSAFFSSVKQISFFGNLPTIHGSAFSWVLYILIFFLAISHLKKAGQVRLVLYALLTSGVFLSIITLLSYFGIYLPWQFAHVANFTPSGSSFSTAAFLILMLPLPLLSIARHNRVLSSATAGVLSCLFLATIVLIGNLAAYVGLVTVFLLIIFIQRKHTDSLRMLAVPVGIAALLLIFSFAPFGGPLHQKEQTFPRELQLPFVMSWKISASSFRDTPFLGTGPSTYLFDFTFYKPIEYNSTPYWNINFETAFDEFLQIFAILGGLGVLSFLFLTGVILTIGWKGLSDDLDNIVGQALSVSTLLLLILLIFHTSTVVLITTSFLLLALLFAARKDEKTREISIGIKVSSITDSNLIAGDLLPSLFFIIFLVLVLFILFNPFGLNALNMIKADHHHRIALDAASTQGIVTYNELVQSEQLNPLVDLYRTDLAQTNFALANAIATSKGPTQASPSGSLTDADKQNIQTLLSQSINEGKAAVTLNPLSAQNWEILASIYRQISGVAQNALNFSLSAYGQAIQRDPANPLLRLNAGGVYYSVKNYQLAIRFFTDAANLKPDYANAYYNLSIALRDSGDLQNAIAADQQVLSLVAPNSADYQTAQKLLSELQTAQKNGSNNQPSSSTAQPPAAAATTSALQQQNLPNVLNLPQPSSVATPSAIGK